MTKPLKKLTKLQVEILEVAIVCPDQVWTEGKMAAGVALLTCVKNPRLPLPQICAVLTRRGVGGCSSTQLTEVVHLFVAAGLLEITGGCDDDVSFQVRDGALARLKAILTAED